MANSFLVTEFTSMTLATFLQSKSSLIATSYKRVTEFESNKTYAPGRNVEIKYPQYPTTQRGLAITANDIEDTVENYTLSDQDIYSVMYEVDFQSIKLDVVNGEAAFRGDPNTNPEASEQGRFLTDNYIRGAGISIRSDIEVEMSSKMKAAAFYSPIDSPSKLGPVDNQADIRSVSTLENKLGFQHAARMGCMNPDDSASVANSLQNMYNEDINAKITKDTLIGRIAQQDVFYSENLLETETSPQYLVNPSVTVSSYTEGSNTIVFSGVDTVTSTIFNAGTRIAIPSVQLINQANKSAIGVNLVITVQEDAAGDGAGNVSVTIQQPLYATGPNANVDSLPALGAAADVFPGHKNNYFWVPMGIVSTSLPLGNIWGAQNFQYKSNESGMMTQSYIQGVVSQGTNEYRMSTMIATLAMPRYLIHLPSSLDS